MRKVYTLFLSLASIVGFASGSFAQATAGSLPVVLVGFNANLTTSKEIAISWTTQQQIITDCFDVEKSSDGNSWRTIVTVKSTGTSSIPVTYTTHDAFPLKGTNFYRVRIKSLNGDVGYTIIKIVRMTSPGRITIYPNPSVSIVNISLGEVPQGDWNLSFINNLGKVIVQKKYSRYTTTVSLPVGDYINGNYNLEITDGNFRQSNKLMINHN